MLGVWAFSAGLQLVIRRVSDQGKSTTAKPLNPTSLDPTGRKPRPWARNPRISSNARENLRVWTPERFSESEGFGRRSNVGTRLRNPGPITPKIVGFIEGTPIKAQGFLIRFLH